MRLVVVACLLLLVVLSSCGEPRRPPGSPDPRFGAPVPGEVRYVRAAAIDPCGSLLAPSDWQKLGFSPNGSPRTVASGDQSCRWVGPQDERLVSVIVSPNRDVLVDSYRLRRFAIFEPIALGESPAVREQTSADSSSCTVTVGTAVGQGLIATYDERSPAAVVNNPPCESLQRIVARILENLPAGSAK